LKRKPAGRQAPTNRLRTPLLAICTLLPGCDYLFVAISLAARVIGREQVAADGADAPALFSGTRETVWAALPTRPAALRRNPALRAGSSTSFQPYRLLFKAVKQAILCA